MKKIITCLCIIGFSLASFAKTTNLLCNGVTGSDFNTGDGSTANPYLICNNLQLNRISVETALLNKSFQLGSDLSYLGAPFNIIGSDATPFQGAFNGDGYTLSNINVTIPSGRLNYFGPFGYMKNASISNLNFNALTINAPPGTQHLGGIAGYAENSSLLNVQISGLSIRAVSRSGGLIGYAINCTVQNSSTNGTLVLNAYASGVAGLIGRGDNSRISSSYSNARIADINSAYFGAKVGGLFGYLVNSQVSDVYSQGSIDFSNVTNFANSSGIGGIVGIISGGSLNNAYFAGTMLNMQSTSVGGAIGSLTNTTTNNVIWNQISSGQSTSAAGIPSNTCLMTSNNYWLNFGFSTSIWKFIDGTYPKLVWQP